MKCYSTILPIVLPIVTPIAAPVAPIAASEELVSAAPVKLEMAVPVPAAPNTPAAPNEAAITRAAITQHVPTIIPPITVEAILFLVMIDLFFWFVLLFMRLSPLFFRHGH
jgi:hypothetical protein